MIGKRVLIREDIRTLEIGLHGESVQKGPLFQKVSQSMINKSA